MVARRSQIASYSARPYLFTAYFDSDPLRWSKTHLSAYMP